MKIEGSDRLTFGGLTLPEKKWGWFLARGLLLIALGVVSVALPGPALFTFAMLFAAFCFVNGGMTLASGIKQARSDERADDTRWWSLVLSGTAGILIGAIFVLFPFLFTVAYGLTAVLLIAAWAVVTGALEVIAAIRLRKAIKGEWLLALSGALTVLVGLAIAVLAAITPGLTALSVAWLIGVYAIVAGILLTILAFRLRKRNALSAGASVEPAQSASAW